MALSLDFVFEGFRTLRARPRLLWLWGVVTLVGNGIGICLLVALGGRAFERIQIVLQHALEGTADLAVMPGLLQQAAPGILALHATGIVVAAVLTAAICRIGEDGEDGLAFLRFGPRELQLIAVTVITEIIIFGAAGICLSLGAVAAAVLTGIDGASPACMAAGFVTAAVIAFWLHVRLMFNRVQSFAGRRIDVFGGFSLTREPFWTLLGGSLVVTILGLVVIFLCQQAVAAVVALVFGPEALTALAQPDMTSLPAFLTAPKVMTLVLLYGLVSPQVMAIVLAPQVAAYRAVSGRDALTEAEDVA